jgi:23S rRNA (guanosine2251-2'-O)-methyltransferase
MKLNAQEMRTVEEQDVAEAARTLKRKPIYLILENIYDTYNVGGLFRLADGMAVERIYLCGTTEVPPNSKIKKASIGTYKVVPWVYKNTAAEAIAELRNELSPTITLDPKERNSEAKKLQVIAIEQDTTAVPYTEVEYTYPIALLVGNETYGVLPETLKLVNTIVEIPMWGINKSLNVIVSAAIVCYHALGKLKENGSK